MILGCVGLTKILCTWTRGRFWGERGSWGGGRGVFWGGQGQGGGGEEKPPHPPHHPLGPHQHLLLPLLHDHHRLLVRPLQSREEPAGLWELLWSSSPGNCSPHWCSHWRQVLTDTGQKCKIKFTKKSIRPWRLVHAIHPVLFGCVYAVFSLSYYLAGGTNYHFEPWVWNLDIQAWYWTCLTISGMSTTSQIGVELVEQLEFWLASPLLWSPSMPSSV